MSGIEYPASRNRLTTSWVAMAIATDRITTHPRGAKIRVPMTRPASSRLTAIAAGRLRPAFEVVTGGVSVSATVACLLGSSDLQQLAFFVLDQLVDLVDV